jgi:hypothetical protein
MVNYQLNIDELLVMLISRVYITPLMLPQITLPRGKGASAHLLWRVEEAKYKESMRPACQICFYMYQNLVITVTHKIDQICGVHQQTYGFYQAN